MTISGCRHCEQARKFVGDVWRKLRRYPPPSSVRVCIVDGCSSPAVKMICGQHWWELPTALRHRWWRETDYGRRLASKQLVDEINRVIRAQRSSNAL